jgi:NitT/TauT family transport system ATP-binding protein
MTGEVAIRVKDVSHQFGEEGDARHVLALRHTSLDVARGELLCLIGPSGCGKSTLLNVAAGLQAPSEGRVEIFGQALAGLNRRAGYMFQQDALLPWKTVIENIALGLELRGTAPADARREAAGWAERIGLGTFAHAFPAQLSGGMKKRASMAQSFIGNPDILLMDEPFSALDVHTRTRMEGVLLELWTASPKTILFVTHDLEEALALADEVLVLSAGPSSGIVGRFAVDLRRPRDLMDIRTEPRFSELYREIWSLLRKEVLRSYDRVA